MTAATWEQAVEHGWTLRPGATLRVLVAERGGSRVFAADEAELLSRIADVERKHPQRKNVVA